jgi:hypothetical protein
MPVAVPIHYRDRPQNVSAPETDSDDHDSLPDEDHLQIQDMRGMPEDFGSDLHDIVFLGLQTVAAIKYLELRVADPDIFKDIIENEQYALIGQRYSFDQLVPRAMMFDMVLLRSDQSAVLQAAQYFIEKLYDFRRGNNRNVFSSRLRIMILDDLKQLSNADTDDLDEALIDMHLNEEFVQEYHGEHITLEEGAQWSGVIGNARDHAICIKFWEQQTGLNRNDVKCISEGCDNGVIMGIHIWSKEYLDKQWHFIAPSCRLHNSPNQFNSAWGWFPAREGTSIVRSECICARLNGQLRPPRRGCAPHGDLPRERD